MLILFESFLGILLLDPHFFFHHIIAQVRASIRHFENSSPLLWNPRYSEKDNLPDPFRVRTHFFFCYAILYESKHTKLMTSLIFNLSFAVFHRQSLSCEVINKSQCNLNSSLLTAIFSLCALPGLFQLRNYFSKFRFDFLCANLAKPIISYSLFSNVQSAVV